MRTTRLSVLAITGLAWLSAVLSCTAVNTLHRKSAEEQYVELSVRYAAARQVLETKQDLFSATDWNLIVEESQSVDTRAGTVLSMLLEWRESGKSPAGIAAELMTLRTQVEWLEGEANRV